MLRINHDIGTGKITKSELSLDEIADLELLDAKRAHETAIYAETQAQKVAAKAVLLAKLGITESEAALLLS